MGGDIDCFSQGTDLGSTFEFRIPLRSMQWPRLEENHNAGPKVDKKLRGKTNMKPEESKLLFGNISSIHQIESSRIDKN